MQLQDGGVQVDCITNGILTNSQAKVKLGHHLSTLLRMMEGRKKDKDLAKFTHWMVLGYAVGPDSWLLDLPGGKRHLGESTLDCAVRETEEECSVTIDREWISGDHARKLHDGECNNFFLVEPPPASS